jgi:uncharacterized protein YjbJ (UPF0337 family)
VKEAAGVVSGNRELEEEGADERARGAAQEGLGRGRHKVGEAFEDVGKDLKE